MLVSHRKRFIYLKTLKTAGTSVEILFAQYCCPPQQCSVGDSTAEIVCEDGIVGYRGSDPSASQFYNHMPAHQIRDKIGVKVFESYFKFCVVRNPYDKVVSMWWFRLDQMAREAFSSRPFGDVKQAFKSYVLGKPGRLPLDRQIYMIDGVPIVNKFVRFENLVNDIKEVCLHLEIEFSEQDLGNYKSQTRSRVEHYSDYYDDETRDVIAKKFSWELEFFRYNGFSDGART